MSSTPSNILMQSGESNCRGIPSTGTGTEGTQGPKDSELRLWSARPRHSARRPGRSYCSKLVCPLTHTHETIQIRLNSSLQSTHCWCHALALLLRRSRTTDPKLRGTPRSHSRSCSDSLYQVLAFPHLMTMTSDAWPQHPPTKVGCGIYSRALGRQTDFRRPRIREPCPRDQPPSHSIS